MMNIKPVQIRLSVNDINEILRISLDDDQDNALHYVKTVLAKQVEKALQRH